MGCTSERGDQAVRFWLDMAAWADGDSVARIFFPGDGWLGGFVQGREQWDVPAHISPSAAISQLVDEGAYFAVVHVTLDGKMSLAGRGASRAIWVRQGTLRGLAPHERDDTFDLTCGDHVALLDQGYLESVKRAGQDPAIWIRRWSSIGMSAEQLCAALVNALRRLNLIQNGGMSGRGVVVLHARPMVSITVWSGPPREQALDQQALDALMAEPGTRIICGDTTAQIAARLLARPLRVEQVPREMRAGVPPQAHLEGIHLVTEGLITLELALARLQNPGLGQQRDAATELAALLSGADRIRFVVGTALNPAQADPKATEPRRIKLIQQIADLLLTRPKLVSVEYL